MGEKLKFNLLQFLPILFVLALSGCSKEPETEGYINIDDQYAIKMHQLLSPTGGVPALEVSTIEPHECTNSYISHTVFVNDQNIQISLNEVGTEGECITGNEHIFENIPIETSALSTPFEINVKDIVTNSGSLQLNKVDFELKLHNFDGLKILKTKISRIHQNEIWGTFDTTSDEIRDQLRALLSDLDEAVNQTPGDYGYFYVAQDLSVTVYGSDLDNSFLITSTLNVEELETVIVQLKEIDPQLEFHATYFDGRVLNIQ